MSWAKGPIRTKRGLRYDATLSSLSHRLAGVCTACFAYVHATVSGGRVSHHQNPSKMIPESSVEVLKARTVQALRAFLCL